LYDILETVEAGIVLSGTEAKSLRMGRASLVDSFASFDHGELFLHNMHISPYEPGNRYNPDPTRSRKLLLHKQEIKRLIGRVTQRGLTLVPLRVYFGERGYAKVELALAKGKKVYDRRKAIKERDLKRELEREMKDRL
jgi:SsrA-binding protein